MADELTAALAQVDSEIEAARQPKQSQGKPASRPPAAASQGGTPRAKSPPGQSSQAADSSGGVMGALTRIVTGASQGAINTVGAPVDFVNWGLGKLTGGYVHSDAPIGGSKSITKAFGLAGYKEEGDPRLGKPSGTAEKIATKTAEFLGGSIVPVAGLAGRGAYLLRAGGEGALQSSSSATVRALNQMAVETAKHPVTAIAGEVGGALGAATAGTAAEELAPDNDLVQAGAEIVGGVLGGVGAGVSTVRREAASVGMDIEGNRVLGWSQRADGTETPIIAPKREEAPAGAVGEEKLSSSSPSGKEPSAAPKKPATSAAMMAEDDRVSLTAEVTGPEGTPRELPVGTIGRAELADLQGEVQSFRARVDAGDARAPDITWERAASEAAEVGEFRLGNLGDADDTASLLGALSRQLPSKGTRSDAELMSSAKAAADDIGEDPEAMLALGRQIAGQLGDADSAMATLRTVWSRSSKEINELYLAKVDWTQADDTLVAHAGEAIRNLSVMSQMVQQAKVGLGRGLRVLQLDDADSYLKKLLGKEAVEDAPVTAPREMPPIPTSKEDLKDWFDLWGMTDGDPSKQSAMLQGLLTVPTAGKYLRQSVANFFTASILSAPRSIMLNVIGPGYISVLRNLERLSGAAVQSINPMASAAERQSARAVAQYTAKAYVQTMGDIGQVFQMALRSAELNHTVIGGHGQTLDALTSFGPFTENLLKQAGEQPSTMYTLGNAINFFPRAFARLNNGLDEFAKRLAYQGEVRVNAMVEGAQQGLSGKELQAYVDNALKSSYDEVGHAADKELLRSAERTTLTSAVGEDGSLTRKFANFVQQMRSDVPETRFILPVFNVPANALGETLRRLPIARIPGLNNILYKETAAELAGERGPVAQAEAHGRFLLGSSFLLAGILLNKQGLLTGAGPQDPTDRKVWLQTHQPYSIRVNGNWVRYDKFDIAGGLLSVPATVADMTTYNPDDGEVQDHLFAGMGALAQWFKDRAALRTATDILNAGSDPTKDIGTLLSRTGGGIVAGFFPAAARTLITDTTSPYVAMKRSWEDYVQASIPGLANMMEPIRNVLGEPVRKSQDTIPEAIIPVSLTKAIGKEDDAVLVELDRLYQETGYGAGADSRSLGYGYFAPQDVKLEDGRSMYYHFMQARQTMKLDGKTLRQALDGVFKSGDYKRGVDADSGSRKTSRGDYSRGYMVKEVFSDYNKAIKAEMAAASPKAKAYLVAAAAKQKDDAYLRDVSVEDLVTNPRLYGIKGVNKAGFEDKVMKGSTGALMESLSD